MRTKIILIVIIILAFVLRFYKLDSYPAFNADEAAIGYNAYSLIQTGMDEHGHPWPIHFQSFNDYKPGLYFYLVLPFVKFMGLNEWAVRTPNALLSVASVYLLYLLVKELYKKDKLALISAFLLAISPWHIHFSRGGWEVSTATFFIILGVLMFIRAVNKQRILSFIFSLVPFVLSMYTYHSARVISPLLALGLMIIYKNEIFTKKNIKLLVVNFLLLILMLIPLAHDLLSSNALSRVAGVGLFADVGPINRLNEQRGEHPNPNSIVAKIVHNKLVNYSLAFGNNYLTHFSGEFLFMTGDSIQRNKVPETGEMYLFDVILLGFGIFYISRNFDKNSKLVIWWLLVAPIASSLTFQSPNALRSENMVIPLTIISALGLNYIFSKKMKIVNCLLIITIVWCATRYLYLYYNFMSKEYPFSSQYGVKELVTYVNESQNKFKNIVVTDRYDQPYILFLFYMKYPPQNFQNHHTLTFRDEFGFSTVRDFDKYHFYSIKFDEMKNDYPNSLIIGTSEEIPKEANVVKKIYGTNGYEYFDVVAN